MKSRRVVDADLAAVHPHVEDDAAPPARSRPCACSARKFGASSKPCSRIICSLYMPQPSTNSGASTEQPGQRRMPGRHRQLQVVARVGLVDAGVADRRAVVLAHGVGVVVDRRGHDVDARRDCGPTCGGSKYAANGITLRRYSGVAMTSIRSSAGTVTMSCSIRCRRARSMTSRYAVERLVERGGVVALDAVDDLGLVGVRVDLARRGTRAALFSASCCSPISRIASASRPSNARSPMSSSYVLPAERPVVVGAGPAISWSQSAWSRPLPCARVEASRQAAQLALAEHSPRRPRHDLVEEARACPRLAWSSICCHRRDLAARRRASGARRGTSAPPPAGAAIAARRSAAARSRGRRAGTARRRRVHAPWTGAPRRDGPRASKIDAPQVVELELALEAGLGGQAGRVDRLDRREVRSVVGRSPAGPRRGCRRRAGGRQSWMPRKVANGGMVAQRRRKRASTRS